jgi:hypothetical protein
MPDPRLAAVRDLLSNVEPGKLSDETISAIVGELRPVWEELEGATDAKMAAYKLDRGCEWAWTPPLLRFLITRHGGPPMGSSRGERQLWSLNVQEAVAHWVDYGFVQLKPQSPPFRYELAVQEITSLIDAGPAAQTSHDGLVWVGTDRARVTLNKFLPESANKATQASRIKRLREKLVLHLSQLGWDVERDKSLIFFKRN